MPLFHRRPLARCIALSSLCAALLAPPAWAVGLGEVALQSHLGKPLQARIPLTHLGDLSGDQIKVTLGSDDDYTRLGVDRDYLHSQIRMEPVVAGGKAYLQLTTTQPVVEPYINFVISLRWPNGQLAREYTLLLDVPPMALPATASSAAVAAPTGNIAAAAAAADAAPRTYAPTASASTGRAPVQPVDGRYRTQRGDSLWGLAQRLRPAGVSVEQMMAALHAANPEAFLNGDPTRLKEAVELTVPDAVQAAAAGPLPTVAPAPTPELAAPAAAATEDRFAGRSAGEAVVAPETEAVADSGPRLELLAPSDVEQLTAENAALREEVKSLTSNVGALTSQLDRSEQRLQQLESQLQQVLAGYDRQQGVAGSAEGGSPFATGAVAPATAGPAESGVSAAPALPEREGSLWMHISYWIALGAIGGWALYLHSRNRRVDESNDDALEPVAAPLPATTARPASVARVTPREEERKEAREAVRVETRNEQRYSQPEPARAPSQAVPVAAPPVQPTEVDPAAAWGSAEENERYWHHRNDNADELPLDLLDEEPVADKPFAVGGAAAGVEDSVDASISAGVFLAFGRYSEAEQVLQEALQRDPSRHDLKLQLLDVYQQADMREAFDQLARAIESECADQPGVVAEVAALRDSYSGRF